MAKRPLKRPVTPPRHAKRDAPPARVAPVPVETDPSIADAPVPLATAPLGPAVAWNEAVGQIDGAGALVMTAGTAGALTGPLVALKDVRVQIDAAGALLVTSVTAGAITGPPVAWPNLRVRTDANGQLVVAAITGGAATGPRVAYANLRGRTDANGALVVANGTATGASVRGRLPNLRGRADDQGALVVTGLASAPPAVVSTTGSPGANASAVTTIVAAAFANTAGNRLVAFVRYNTGAKLITGITDTAGNSWSYLGDVGSAGGHLEAWMTTPIAAHAANVVTATLSAPSPYNAIIVVQVSGATGADIVAIGGPVTAPTVTTTVFTTTVAAELILAGNDVAELNTPVWAPNVGFAILREDPTHIMMVQSSSVTTIQAAKTVSATQTTDAGNAKTIIAVSLK